MANLRIFAIGKIDKGGHAVVITRQQAEACAGAYVMGESDAYAGKPCEPLQHYGDLLCIESYIVGYEYAKRDEDIANDPAYVPDWQAFVDHAAQAEIDEYTAEYVDYQDDVDWMRGGC